MNRNFITTPAVPQFYFLNPKPEDIHIEDIACALSKTCRFNGLIPVFYSVAEHSILVSKILEKQGAEMLTVFAGLLHDAEEAYLPDIPSPIKKVMTEVQRIYFRLSLIISEKYGINYAKWEAIEDIDRRLCTAEARALGIWNDQWDDTGESLEVDFFWLSPEDAEEVFLKRYAVLRDKL